LYFRIGKQRCGDGRHRDEEVGTKICAETGDEAGWCLERDGFFDVEVETVEGVGGYEVVEGCVVCFELLVFVKMNGTGKEGG
jgi:hypothetical protein